ncbi:uncharacterized protein LOC116127998 isoform X3 [Pistacia vera]|uniref:uncharacterized protein LOC116127998 isoform X2 n=1 Tax=Pistacia vera TaxID=55513 RepID=UPI001263CD27|nr:uncharacterized protein LOC116127998 isoform X2 [Pistacia vera]XP_031269528.1 uncharacterized protein LOC116127998 isoform X2 [Pistacia vera]XP_031269529.1 uncharacterized protein LOC116127998 isoform X3 [Pistacia vera]
MSNVWKNSLDGSYDDVLCVVTLNDKNSWRRQTSGCFLKNFWQPIHYGSEVLFESWKINDISGKEMRRSTFTLNSQSQQNSDWSFCNQTTSKLFTFTLNPTCCSLQANANLIPASQSGEKVGLILRFVASA